jgi:hypothetical protein
LCRAGEGDAAEARAQLDALAQLPAITAIDRIDRAHALALPDEPSESVCQYSRDAFGGLGT